MLKIFLDAQAAGVQGPLMHLKDFLRPSTGRRMSNADFAAMVGKSEATVSRWVEGQVMPDPESLTLILQATDRLVTPNDMHAGLQRAAAEPAQGAAA